MVHVHILGFKLFFSYRPGWCDRRRAPFGSRLRLRLYTWVSHSLCRCGGCTSILTPSNASKTPPGQYGLAHLKTTAMYSYRHKVCDQTIIYKYKNTLFLPWWKIIIGEGRTSYLPFEEVVATLHPLQAVNYHVTVKKVHLIPLSNFRLMPNSVSKDLGTGAMREGSSRWFQQYTINEILVGLAELWIKVHSNPQQRESDFKTQVWGIFGIILTSFFSWKS